jgi:hypothetical protein
MNMRSKAWALALLGSGIVLTLSMQRPAESQVQVAPTYSAVGVATSGATSTAWFHHQASGRIVACQLVSGGGAIQCADGRLP